MCSKKTDFNGYLEECYSVVVVFFGFFFFAVVFMVKKKMPGYIKFMSA